MLCSTNYCCCQVIWCYQAPLATEFKQSWAGHMSPVFSQPCGGGWVPWLLRLAWCLKHHGVLATNRQLSMTAIIGIIQRWRSFQFGVHFEHTYGSKKIKSSRVGDSVVTIHPSKGASGAAPVIAWVWHQLDRGQSYVPSKNGWCNMNHEQNHGPPEP